MNTAENRNGAATKRTPSVPVVTVEAPETPKRHSKAYGESSVAAFEPSPHADHEAHHHHTHGEHTHHEHGHHLLQVEHLSVSFRMYEEDEPFFQARRRDVEVIHDLSVSVHEGEVIAVVGASGSGKSLLADAILGLYEPNATVTGRIWFDGEECSAARLEELRGHGISLVPQSTANLDPLMRVGKQVEGLARNRQDKQRRQARRKELFARYGLAEDVAKMYPHELSGGMTRRVLLCCALMDEPRLIVADEPTPGLDLDLACKALADLRAFADEGGGVMLITHDIELALRVADRVAVFQDGTVVEETSVVSFNSPDTLRHPFSRQLWHALPEHGFACTVEEDAVDKSGKDDTPTQTSGTEHVQGGTPC